MMSWWVALAIRTVVGGAGDDAVDGGAGINIYEVSGTPDGFYAQVNSSGSYVLTDLVVGGDELSECELMRAKIPCVISR